MERMDEVMHRREIEREKEREKYLEEYDPLYSNRVYPSAPAIFGGHFHSLLGKPQRQHQWGATPHLGREVGLEPTTHPIA